MLCNECKKNKANFFYKINVNGNVREISLCQSCAKKLGYNVGSFDLFDSFFDLPAPGFIAKEAKRCPLCNSSFDEIRESGKIGCAECYDFFSDMLADTITSIHGTATHTGRQIKPAKKANRSKLQELKDSLNEAISAERFEDAAKLRDEIKAEEEKQNG